MVVMMRMLIVMILIVVDGRHVRVQSVFPLESPTAEAAGELLISVKGLVSPQVITVAKPLTTSLTHVLGTVTVLPLLVLLEQLPSSEGLATHVTRNLLIDAVVHVVFVRLQSSVGAEVFAAHLAHVVQPHVGLLLGHVLLPEVSLPVGGQRGLEAEGEATLRALEGPLPRVGPQVLG